MEVIGRQFLRNGAESEITVISGIEGDRAFTVRGYTFAPAGSDTFAVAGIHVWPDSVWVSLDRLAPEAVTSIHGHVTVEVQNVQAVTVRPLTVEA